MRQMIRKLFLNKEVWGIVIFGALLYAALASHCHGAELDLEVGASYIRYEAPVVGLSLDFPKAGPIDTDYLVGLHIIGASDELRNNAALTFGLVDGFGRFDIMFGVCLLHHTDARNGSMANFFLGVGYRFGDRHNPLRARHCSNAGMTDVNKGLDFVTQGWRVRP